MFLGSVNAPHWSDYVFYGGVPTVIYLWLIASAWGIWQGASIAYTGVGVGILALLLLGDSRRLGPGHLARLPPPRALGSVDTYRSHRTIAARVTTAR